MDSADLQPFFEGLVRELRSRGILCAITSGMACVHYQTSLGTKDCDLLVHERAFSQLLDQLAELRIDGQACRYRGHLSPPLDPFWHRGGWTSHFQWGQGQGAVTLDVFGRALRADSPWEHEIHGLYVSPHIVAQMKRTNRAKDWPFISGLARRMILGGDARGWLHLYDVPLLRELLAAGHRPPEACVRQRPSLSLALEGKPRLTGIWDAERRLWEWLDEHRIAIYRRALRPYVVAVGRARLPEDLPLAAQHRARLELASAHLAASPLVDYGLERHLQEGRRWLVTDGSYSESVLEWLPDFSGHFRYLQPA